MIGRRRNEIDGSSLCFRGRIQIHGNRNIFAPGFYPIKKLQKVICTFFENRFGKFVNARKESMELGMIDKPNVLTE